VTDASSATASKDLTILIQAPSAGFAQVASGGGWKTILGLVNASTVRVTARISFYGDNGLPLTLPLVSSEGINSTGSFVDASIEVGGTFLVETEASGSTILTGWASVESSLPLTGYSVFRYRTPGVPDSEGTTLLDTRAMSSVLLPYDNTGGFQTGVALVNQGSASSIITAILRDERGQQISVSQISLPGFGHNSFFLSNMIAASANRRGTVEFQNPSGNVTAIGLRFSPSGSFTSLPILR
jgi:hypothetical protein